MTMEFSSTAADFSGQNMQFRPFLVNALEIHAGFRYKWLVKLLSCRCDMVPEPQNAIYNDLQSIAGITGQGPETPSQKAFVAHFILEFNGIFYDPSYGVTYTGEGTFEANAVFGLNTQPFLDEYGHCNFTARAKWAYDTVFLIY